jgi:hypothetical protein
MALPCSSTHHTQGTARCWDYPQDQGTRPTLNNLTKPLLEEQTVGVGSDLGLCPFGDCPMMGFQERVPENFDGGDLPCSITLTL